MLKLILKKIKNKNIILIYFFKKKTTANYPKVAMNE
jgi:hypothetical protein